MAVVINGNGNITGLDGVFSADSVNTLVDTRIDSDSFVEHNEFNALLDARIDSADFVAMTGNQTIAGVKTFSDSAIFTGGHLRVDGNVGISETNPQHKLDIQGSSSGINIDGGGTNPYINLVEAGDTGFQITYDGASTNDFLINSGFSGSLTTNRLTLTRDEGDLTITGGIVAPGSYRIGTHKYYKQNWWFGGSTDLNWKKIADVTLDTGSYAAASFLVKYIDPGSNFGASVVYEVQEYAVSCGRSSNVQDNLDYGQVRGPYSDRVRAFKTSTGVYEIQVRQYQNYRHVGIEIQAQSDLKATITYAGGSLSNGSTTGTAYTPTGDNVQGKTEGGVFRGLFRVANSSGNQVIRVDADGLKFNADTAADNALDDYEEGTWDSRPSTSTSSVSLHSGLTITNYNGTYTKVGRLVTLCYYFEWSNTSTDTSGVYLVLPFTAKQYLWSGNGTEVSKPTFPSGRTYITVRPEQNNSYASFKACGSAASRIDMTGNLFFASSGGYALGSFSYFTT